MTPPPHAGPRFVAATPAAVRATIAALVVDPARVPGDACAALGDVVLLPHQRDAVRRVHAALDELGGALLADDVGLGKTFVALRVARDLGGGRVVAPAALRATWRDAMRRCGVALRFTSMESLGRRGAARARDDAVPLVVVDEAHHARNPATRRHRALADLAVGRRVLLLSATPIHNRAAELHALIALFLGGRASRLDEATLARCIVRRRAVDDGGGGAHALARAPRVLPVRAHRPAHDDGTLDRLLALPPPIAAADGGVAAALVALGLVRQWASSVAALRGALRRRLARTVALEAAVRAGAVPTRAALRRAVVSADAVQPDLPGLLDDACADAAALLPALAAHETALRHVLRTLDDAADDARAACLRRLRAVHPGARIVAFAAYADTVAAMFRRLRADGGACVLTARGALVAGGRLTRREALHRFAPHAHGRAPPRAAEAITLLLATDVLSEGIGLQDASVVVHLDLPWTPARLAQRVGRVARLGSPHAEVAVHALMPPASAEAWLGAERRLRAKLGEAARLVGAIGAVLPSDDVATTACSAPGEDAEAIRATLHRWRDAERVYDDDRGGPIVAAVRGPPAARGALLAAVGRPPRLVARTAAGGAVTTRPTVVRAVLAVVAGEGAPADAAVVREAVAAVARWQGERRAERAVGDGSADPLRARLLRRVAAAVVAAPRDRRARVAALADAARCAIGGARGAGVERRLARLLDVEVGDEPWLREVAACAAADPVRAEEDVAPLHAMLVVAP